jgi:hypothetical protein
MFASRGQAFSSVSAPITQYSDLLLAFLDNTFINPATTFLPELQTASTPYGPGFQFSVSDTADVTLWDSTLKAVLVKVKTAGTKNVVMNKTQLWNFYIYLPSQSLVTSWNGGTLWEFHTPFNASGHTLELDNTGRGPTTPSFRFGFETAGGASYTYAYNWAPLTFNTWHHVTIYVRWSTGADGFYQAWLDGTRYMNRTGATVYTADNGTPFLQFGLYADIGSQQNPVVPDAGTNQITYGGITLR